MAMREIVLPETKPETEWVRGRALQKVSPTRTHARLQLVLGSALHAWARGRGEIGTEWRFRIAPPGEVRRPLVPDIAYVDRETLSRVVPSAREIPTFPPTVAIEIRSPGDRRRDIDEKISVYLRAGTRLVIVIDPKTREATLVDPDRTRVVSSDGRLRHDALPEFDLDLRAFFAEAIDGRP